MVEQTRMGARNVEIDVGKILRWPDDALPDLNQYSSVIYVRHASQTWCKYKLTRR